MNRLKILAILMIITLSASAQKSYIAINLGTSIPMDNFASVDDLFESGFAVSGFSIEFDGMFFPGQVLGVGAMIGFGSVYTGQDDYFARLGEYAVSHPDLAGLSFPALNETSFTTGFWNYMNFMTGPELSASVWRFQAGVRAMGGLSVIISPVRDLVYEGDLDTIEASTKGTTTSLAYLYGGSLMYYLGEGTAIRLVADYYSARGKYNFNFDAETPLANVSETVRSTVGLSVLQLSFGLSYTF